MKHQGIMPLHQVLYNEISKAYKDEIRATGMTYQLVPTNDHLQNIAQKDIKTWKDHFICVLCGTAAKLLLHL